MSASQPLCPAQRKIIFSTTQNLAEAAEQRCQSFGIDGFGVDDYAALAVNWLGPERAKRVDFEKVFRFAPKLNAHQLKGVCGLLAQDQGLNTDLSIELLRSQRLASNVHLGEVQAADLEPLVEATEGFTGADLKRAVEDAKAIGAYDKAQQVALQPPLEYFLRAVDAVKENKASYAEAEAQAAMQSKAGASSMQDRLTAAALMSLESEKS